MYLFQMIAVKAHWKGGAGEKNSPDLIVNGSLESIMEW